MKLKLLAILFIVTSCTPSIKNFDKYQKQFISKSEFMPDEKTLENKLLKVAIFDFEEGDIEVAKQSNLGKSVATNMESILSKYRLAELVDRKATEKLQKEVQLSEMNKTGSYKGPKLADYAVSGSIANANFANKYVAGSTFVNPKTGDVISIPPKFVYSSQVAGNIKIYELPSLTVIDTIELNGKSVRTENVQQDGGISLGGIQIGGTQEGGVQRDDGLVREAGADAVDEAESAIRNAFAKRGFILEKRTFDGKSIFKVNLGSEDGVKHGDKFELIGQYEVENSITGKSEVERRVVGLGVISDKIDPKNCWIILEDKKNADVVRIGDMIKMKYSKSAMKSFAKMAKNMTK
jgi:curli biogenesis system outer membrane secretion channel CsgG